MSRLLLRQALWGLVLCPLLVLAEVRPHSLEQYIADNIGWPASITHGKYQSKYEFAFMDSDSDTCESGYPWGEEMVSAGITDCYDLRPPNWANVSCSGNSAQHPTLSNVYIVRTNDKNFSAANNSGYRWVLVCPGSYVSENTITVTASGVGLGAGEMRVYDCLDADGSYDPMRYAVTRTGTGDECHLRNIYLLGNGSTNAKYVWFRGFYFEASAGSYSQAAFRVDGDNYAVALWSGLDNVDMYLGGQTAVGSGYKTLSGAVFIRDSSHVWAQNVRALDCVARYNDDGDGFTSHSAFTSFIRYVNVELRNCPHHIQTGNDYDGTFWPAEGHRYENIWHHWDGARNMDNIDPRYWASGRSTQDKIPYGGVNGGNPPSYVKAAAVTSGNIDPAFKCDADKLSANCPFTCSESSAIPFKSASRAANEPLKVRRTFDRGGRISRRDDNNPISDEPSPPGTHAAECGGSSGSAGGSGGAGGQHRPNNLFYDLHFGVGAAPGVEATNSSNTNFSFGITMTNSAFVHLHEPWMNNVYIDEYSVYFIDADSGSGAVEAGEQEFIHLWGSTGVAHGYDTATSWTDRQWIGPSTRGSMDMDCMVMVDSENDAPGDTGVGMDYLARYGNAGTLNAATNIYPTSGTYDKSVLSAFTHIVEPFTIIANGGPVTTKSWDNLIPAVGSPIEGQCAVATP